MLNKVKNYILVRVKNYGFWVSLFALIPLAVQAFGDASSMPSNYDEIVNLILSLLVAIGICNNPTTVNRWFKDDNRNGIPDDQEQFLTPQRNQETEEAKG